MSGDAQAQRPAWQTFELEEEWPDDEEGSQADDSVNLTRSSNGGSSSLSFTGPAPSLQLRTSRTTLSSRSHSPSPPESPRNAGTFLVREDAPGPDLSRTPAAGKKGAMKNFFSPLALERMFDPPSPPKQPSSSGPYNPTAPPIPSRLSQAYAPESFSQDGDTEIVDHNMKRSDEILETDLPNVGGFGGLRPSMDCQFTFAAPLLTSDNGLALPGHPQAESTPAAAHANPHPTPATDSRLRLFQFQYDTFTRDHLSAMVDSIAVNSPSLSNTGNLTNRHSSPFGLSRVTESTTSAADVRSAKRVKLSPISDFEVIEGEGERQRANANGGTVQKDYVGESKSLMAQIRQARDFSTISSVTSRSGISHTDSPQQESPGTRPQATQQPFLSVARAGDMHSGPGSATSSKGSSYSSLGFRAKGAELMAQIRQDFKGSKRLFSADTDISQASHADLRSEASFRQSIAGALRASQRRDSREGWLAAPAPVGELRPAASAAEQANTSMDTTRLYAQFPIPPISIAPALSPLRVSSTSSAIPLRDTITNPNPSEPWRASGPPAYPSTSLRARTQDDLNRLVSGSTASGTTATAGSSGSFVKHPGPAQITRIAPEDLPSLPERVGAMVFDRTQLRWVKTTVSHGRNGSASEGGYAASAEDGESEDPFRDIESLREDDSEHIGGASLTAHDEQTDGYSDFTYPPNIGPIDEADDEEEAELTSFSFDGPPAQELSLAVGGAFIDEETDSEDEDVNLLASDMQADLAIAERADVAVDVSEHVVDDDNDGRHLTTEPQSPPTSRLPASISHPSLRTPLPPSRNTSAAPTPIRSVLKNASASTIPFSGLRDPLSSESRTPANKSRHRRSVSFSDGKRDGPIRGLGRGNSSGDETASDRENSAFAAAGTSFVPSARSKRIAELMDGLEHSSDDGSSPTGAESSSQPSAEERDRMASWRPQGGVLAATDTTDGLVRRTFSRTPAFSPARVSAAAGNATFLTEASFGVAHDKLVQVITDVQPFEPYWEDLGAIDLSRKHLESVARLKEFLPQLRNLILNHNQLAWLSGVPIAVRTLSVAHNVLTRMTSFNHLLGLESLDVSNNEIDSLAQLQCLQNLRELRADGNRIASLEGLEGIDSLAKLSIQGNWIVGADFTACAWSKLEMLNMSYNRLERVKGLSNLKSLIVLNLDHNALSELAARAPMSRLRVLRLSANRLTCLRVASFPHLRTLYADNNGIEAVVDAHRLVRLENLSLRNQSGRGLTLSIRDVRDVKRLYLSGNPLPEAFLTEPCYNLVYLELAACRLTRLPLGLPALAPNLRALNLNYNFIDDVRPLEGLSRLSKLTVIGSRLKGTKAIIRVLRTCADAEVLDFRMNPCTLGWYLPLLVHDLPGALQPSDNHAGAGATTSTTTNPTATNTSSSGSSTHDGGAAAPTSWQDLDAKFRRDLPDGAYAARLAYRGLVMRACPRVRVLDGVSVSAKERDKAERLLASVLRTAPRAAS